MAQNNIDMQKFTNSDINKVIYINKINLIILSNSGATSYRHPHSIKNLEMVEWVKSILS